MLTFNEIRNQFRQDNNLAKALIHLLIFCSQTDKNTLHKVFKYFKIEHYYFDSTYMLTPSFLELARAGLLENGKDVSDRVYKTYQAMSGGRFIRETVWYRRGRAGSRQYHTEFYPKNVVDVLFPLIQVTDKEGKVHTFNSYYQFRQHCDSTVKASYFWQGLQPGQVYQFNYSDGSETGKFIRQEANYLFVEANGTEYKIHARCSSIYVIQPEACLTTNTN